MEYPYSGNYINMQEAAAWNQNNNPYINNSNIPLYTPTSNFCIPVPYYQSDPRFKQNIKQQPTVVHKEREEQRTDDELWIETYLSKIGKININLNSNIEIITKRTVSRSINVHKKTLKIHVARSVLNRCIKLLGQLEKLETYLRQNVATISSAEWKQKTVEIGQQKDEFSALLAQFDDSTVLDQLRKNLNKRKRKRLSRKQNKLALKRQYEEQLEKCKTIDKKIDQWLEKMQDDVERAKREEYLKRDADCILSEVTKKKSDARKHLLLLSGLVKLRSVREKAAISQGEKINMEESRTFNTVMEKLQNMWNNALNTYGLEEQGLKVMLENNVANEIKVCSKEKKIINDWETILFGPKVIPCDAYWGLTCAEKDLGTFIAIRKSWDTFLVSSDSKEGSKIPVGWVLPLPHSKQWTASFK